MSRAVSSSIGSRRIATSFITSTMHAAEPDQHERPELRVLAHAEDHLDAGDHLLHQEAFDAARGIVRRRAARPWLRRRRAPPPRRASPSVTPPTSVLWLACGRDDLHRDRKADRGRPAPPPRPASCRARSSATSVRAPRAAHRTPRRPDSRRVRAAPAIALTPRRSAAA